MGLAALFQAAAALLAPAPAQPQLPTLTPREKAALVVVSGLPAPRGVAGVIVRGLSGLVGLFGIGTQKLHVGNLHAYVYWFLFGVAALWLFASGVFS